MRSRRRFLSMMMALVLFASLTGQGRAEDCVTLDPQVRARCVEILRSGLASDEFWPSIHAAEGLTLGGHGAEVRAFLEPRLADEQDDQRRCGISRELVRAGDENAHEVMLAILVGEDDYGHVHAAESLYKVRKLGDGKAMRRAFANSDNPRLQLMAAGALTRLGDEQAYAFLRRMLKHDDPDLYHIAAWILGRVGDDSDIPRLKANLERCPNELVRAYHEHSLAALGDPAGRQALLRNLSSTDPAIRTYAATFAGDARLVGAAPRLAEMLDDPHLDARYRAAQSLLVLACASGGKSE